MSAKAFNEVAEQINEERIHVLINLDGWTSAPLINEIITLMPAPVQINFKGFPGTTGCACTRNLNPETLNPNSESRHLNPERSAGAGQLERAPETRGRTLNPQPDPLKPSSESLRH